MTILLWFVKYAYCKKCQSLKLFYWHFKRKVNELLINIFPVSNKQFHFVVKLYTLSHSATFRLSSHNWGKVINKSCWLVSNEHKTSDILPTVSQTACCSLCLYWVQSSNVWRCFSSCWNHRLTLSDSPQSSLTRPRGRL